MSQTRPAASVLLAILAATVVVLNGCNVASSPDNPVKSSAMSGKIMGGQQPVASSIIQLYAVGITGDGSSATPLLSPAVQSHADGSFEISGLYTCPTPTSQLYLVATGGNPGLAAGTDNTAISMMAALGQCQSVETTPFIFVDELTTIGSLAPLAPYMSSYSALGSGSSDIAQFDNALAMVNEFTNIATGSVPGPTLPPGYDASGVEINTLADIMASCINSPGGKAGDGSPCGTLFYLATPSGGTAPTDTIGAALQILKNPVGIPSSLLGLVSGDSPFQPTLTSPPAAWSPAIQPMTAAPSISPAGGNYAVTQSVTLTDITGGATIYYTTNGTPPTVNSSVYSTPITVSASQTVRAIAIATGYAASNTAAATYTFGLPQTSAPTFSLNAGTYAGAQPVMINSSTNGASIYYTTDGSTPTSASLLYTGPINVYASETIQAIAVESGYSNSPVASVAYVITNYGIITTIAGNGATGYSGDGLQATSAELDFPSNGVFDAAGNLYVGDRSNGAVRKITPAGVITTFAGTGTLGYSGDGGPATSAQIENITGMAMDAAGNIYVSDGTNSCIRKVTPAGIISTYAGTGTSGYSGDGGQATSAQLNTPYGLAFDKAGNLYIADYYNNRIRVVTPFGIISTYAGTGTAGFSGDGGPATSAAISGPYGLATNASGDLYFADTQNFRVREITPAGVVSTVAGTGVAGYTGDGGPATSAKVSYPAGVAVDSAGNFYIAQYNNEIIRKVTPLGIISTVAGNGKVAVEGNIGDGGPATSASLSLPVGILVDPVGNLIVMDSKDNLVRKVTYQSIPGQAAPTFSPAAGTYTSIQSVTITPAVSGAAIYYTTDGSIPTISSTQYAGAISVSASESINAISVASGYSNSSVGSAAYVINLPAAAAPTFTPVAGTYASTQNVVISSTTPGASIHYTTDGSTPSPTSTLYVSAVPVSSTETLSAIAVAAGYANSLSATAAYVINSSTTGTTTTTLAITSSGSPVASVGSHTAVKLTAAVAAGATPVTPGQVVFYTKSYTAGPLSIVGTAQLTATGSASLTIVPGAGSHYYKAVFLGTRTTATSTSTSQLLTVTGFLPTQTTLSAAGTTGNYTLNSTLTAAGAATSPSGSVTFTDKTTNHSLGTATPSFGQVGTFGFKTLSNSKIGNESQSVVTADFNGDGIPDLAVANTDFLTGNAADNHLSILLGNGDGTFTAAASPTVSGPLAVGDFNGDGIPDLAVVNYGSNSVTILLGNGDGTFTTGSVLSTGTSPDFIATGDFNGDGIADLAISNQGPYPYTPSTLTILIGNGNGTFTPAASSPATGAFPEWIAVGDFNGDGKTDLAVANEGSYGSSNSSITVLLGNGDGTFTPGVSPYTASTNVNYFSVIAGDFDGDGKTDLLTEDVAPSYDLTLEVLLGNGNGTFQAAKTTTRPNSTYSFTVAAGDFDGDGRTDIALADDATVSIQFSNGDGTFTAGPTTTGATTGPDDFLLAVADFNGDGTLDLATVDSDTQLATVIATQVSYSATVHLTGVTATGSDTVVASYGGDSSYSSSISNPIVLSAAASGTQAAATPTFSPAAGTYTSVQSVTIASSSGAAIYYTTDGSTPTTASTLYSGAIVVNASETLKAIAVGGGFGQSITASAAYVIKPYGVISTIAGNGTAGSTGDGGAATSAELNLPYGVVVDRVGNVYISDASNHRIRKVTPAGIISTYAGNGTSGATGDGGQATSAELGMPIGLALDSIGNLYIADYGNNRIRMVTPGGIISTVAGTGTAGYNGDNGTNGVYSAVVAELNHPDGVAVDSNQNLYIADYGNNRIRLVSNNVISTIAGNGTAGFSGDGGAATSAQINGPLAIALDSIGNIYMADATTNRVRKIAGGTISTVAGSGTDGATGDGGPGTSATLSHPAGLAVDAIGNLYIAAAYSGKVREVSPAGIITTAAGTGVYGSTGDGGLATAAELNFPYGMAVDANNNVYITDGTAEVVRKITYQVTAP